GPGGLTEYQNVFYQHDCIQGHYVWEWCAARLSELGNQYSNNVLDATMGWNKLVTDVAELAGMPESALAAAQAGNRDALAAEAAVQVSEEDID
ncbi:hypothetical protein FK513_32345, partial [Klebsiella pneumoniae]|uniref:glycoside hydrolase family 2 TIM barrel-domain containing protein n=1 Tax=Klebsiella pneumoniae TaxID=573 RepID=UPI0021090992